MTESQIYLIYVLKVANARSTDFPSPQMITSLAADLIYKHDDFKKSLREASPAFLLMMGEVPDYHLALSKMTSAGLSLTEAENIAECFSHVYGHDFKRSTVKEKDFNIPSPNGKPDIAFNNALYYGDVKDNEMNGYGVMIQKNGIRYAGGWKNGKYHGFGKILFTDKDIYFEGEFYNGERRGQGTMFSGGKLDGVCTTFFYTGNYKNNVYHGKGRMLMSNGDMYNGDWKNGVMNGFGVYTFADGSYYEGEFSDNSFNGKGSIHYVPNEENGWLVKYDGYFINDCLNGAVTATYRDGHTETLNFKNGDLIN